MGLAISITPGRAPQEQERRRRPRPGGRLSQELNALPSQADFPSETAN